MSVVISVDPEEADIKPEEEEKDHPKSKADGEITKTTKTKSKAATKKPTKKSRKKKDKDGSDESDEEEEDSSSGSSSPGSVFRKRFVKPAAKRKGRKEWTAEELAARPLGPEHFTKLKLIGKGGVGKVYLVQKRGEGKLYAMKVLHKKEMIEKNKVQRVFTERDILATAEHPFIVTLHYSFQTERKIYFVMAYCPGGEFFRALQRQPGKCLREEHAKFYAAEVLLALEYLHLMGFIYRDLKPENILLDKDGHIMLTDFDLSKTCPTPVEPKLIHKFLSASSDLATKVDFSTNSFVGTAEYLAPEVINGFGHSSSVDWWTYGILLYEMIFGHTPFRGQSRDAVFDAILNGKIPFPDKPPTSKECKALIRKLLHPDPKKRLGAAHGATEIRNHPWFRGFHWALVRNQTPPIVPKVKHELDTSNFRFLKEDSDEEHEEDKTLEDHELDKDNPFHSFRRVEKTKSKLSSSSPSDSVAASPPGGDSKI